MVSTFSFYGRQAIIRTSRMDWDNPDIILESSLFEAVLKKYIKKLEDVDADHLKLFPKSGIAKEKLALKLFKVLSKMPYEEAEKKYPELKSFFSSTYELDQFVENFYNYWRGFERYLVCTSKPGN